MSPHVSILRSLLACALSLTMFCLSTAVAGDIGLQCESVLDDMERLACYDALVKVQAQEGIPAAFPEKPLSATVAESRSYLTRSWDLDNRDEDLLGEQQSPLKPHRVSYLIVRQTNDTNMQPSSPTQVAMTLPVELDPTEIKFQFSQKARVLNAVKTNFLGITSFRLWGAYTQQSSWQAFNSGNSAPFRETVYEPELIMTMSTGNQSGLKLINLGYVHQSNGRNTDFSRSWNRVYLQGGWESNTLSVLARGWWRIPELANQDDNPDILEYIGRAELNLRWAPLDGSQLIGLTLRNNLRSSQNRGFVQLDWATPISVSRSAKLHLQLTSGYGESLIDYNHHQTTLGLGVSFRDW